MSKTPPNPNIEPWRNDAFMKSIWPEWKSDKHKITHNPREVLFSSPYSSKPSVAYANAGLRLGLKEEWEYLGDRLRDNDEVVHWFRHLESRELKGVEAPKTYRIQKPVVAKWVDKSFRSS